MEEEIEKFVYWDHIEDEPRTFWVGAPVLYLNKWKGEVISRDHVRLNDGTVLKGLEGNAHKYKVIPPEELNKTYWFISGVAGPKFFNYLAEADGQIFNIREVQNEVAKALKEPSSVITNFVELTKAEFLEMGGNL